MIHGPSAGAVGQLRRRTITRAFHFYLVWVRRAIGLTTLVYLIAWFVILLITGLQTLAPLAELRSLPSPIVFNGVLVLVLVVPLVRGRVPPVTLNRRDLYRLGLAPVTPQLSLRWSFLTKWTLRASLGVVAGLAWWVVAHTWFAQETPWAAVALALLLVTHLNVHWLRYAQVGGSAGASSLYVTMGALLASLLLGIVVPGIGLGAALYDVGTEALLPPVALALLSSWQVHRSLAERYPARFAAQCFVLGELQAIRTLSTFARLSGTRFEVEDTERAGLLAQLHDKAGTQTPTRSLAPPAAGAPVWRALAWRTNLTLLRRPWWRNGATALQLALASLALSVAAEGLLPLLVAVTLTGASVARLIGPSMPGGLLPITRRARTLGRVVPGMGIACFVFSLALGIAALIGYASWEDVVAIVSLPPLALVSLEKYASWAKVPPKRFEAWFFVSLLALSPLFLLTVAGLPWLIVPVHLGLAWLLLDLPV